MFKNYLKVALRNLWKSKAFSAINIIGLGIGLAACILIFQFVSFHWSFDQFNEKLDRTYRITNDRFQHGKLIQHGTIMYPTIGPTMAKDYPEIDFSFFETVIQQSKDGVDAANDRSIAVIHRQYSAHAISYWHFLAELLGTIGGPATAMMPEVMRGIQEYEEKRLAAAQQRREARGVTAAQE